LLIEDQTISELITGSVGVGKGAHSKRDKFECDSYDAEGSTGSIGI